MESTATAFFARAVDRHQRGALEDAKRLYERALEADSGHVPALFNLATLFQCQADLPAAKRLFERALEADPRHVESLCGLGWLLHTQADPDLPAAKRLYERALGVDPRNFNALYALGRLFEDQADPDQEAAKRLYERALDANPRHVESLCNLGDLLQSQAEPDLEAAKHLYERALEADPRHACSLYNLAQLLQNQAEPDLEAAKHLFERVLEADPRHVLTLFNLGRLLLQQTDPDFEASKRLFERALKADPRHVLSQFTLGALLQHQPNPDLPAAKRRYERALEVDPRHVNTLFSLGRLLQDQADPDQEAAKRLYERALEVDPRNVLTRWHLGGLLCDTGDFSAAMVQFEALEQLEPHLCWTAAGVGDVLRLRDGDMGAARAKYNKALQSNAACWSAFRGLGFVDLAAGDARSARESFEQALASTYGQWSGSRDPPTHAGLGEAHRLLGDVAVARTAFERALELRPGFEPALAGLHGLDPPPAPTTARPHFLTVTPADVEWLDFLERGSFGAVHKARHCGAMYAGKRLPSQEPGSREQLEREARILSSVRHPNVIGFHGISTDPADCFVLLELAEGGSLATLLQRGSDSPLSLRFRILHDVVRGMCRLHDNDPQVLHRDLKPSNVLIMRDGQAKLADFGLSRLDTSTAGTSLQGGVCTVEYTAPELLDDGQCSPASDVFSFGVLAYEVLAARRAWLDERGEPMSAVKVVRRIACGNRPPLPSPAANAFLQDVVERCWAEDPAARPSFAELLREFDGRAHECPQPADVQTQPADTQTRILLELIQVKGRVADVAGQLGTPPLAGAS